MKIRSLLLAGTVALATLAPVASPLTATAAAGCFPKCIAEGVITGAGVIPDPTYISLNGTFRGSVTDPRLRTIETTVGNYPFRISGELGSDGFQFKGWVEFTLLDPDTRQTLVRTSVHVRGEDGVYTSDFPFNDDGVVHLAFARSPYNRRLWVGDFSYTPTGL